MSEHDMQALLDLLEKHLGAAWRDVVDQLRDSNAIGEIVDRINRGDIAGAVEGIDDAVKTFADAQAVAFDHSAHAASAWLSSESGSVVRYDQENTRAVAWANDNAATMVREVTQEQKDLVRRVVRDGVADGRNPREVARDIRDSIGLTDTQAQYVANYRTMLEKGNWSDALGRELTDGRDDRTVRGVASRGGSLTSDQIDTMVERYRSNWVGFRAETIARTEGLRALHEGTTELFKQAIDNGDIDADALVREWNHAGSGKNSRDNHVAIDGEQRGIDDAFSIGLMYPGDPSADPDDVINCRCTLSTRMRV
jgi:Phage Mu protein F like protein